MGPQSCWEFWDCIEEKRKECPAFLTNYGKECFSFAEDYCPRIQRGFRHCRECPWYRSIMAVVVETEAEETAVKT